MANTERAPARLHHEPEAVRWAREQAGLTQTQLAERSGIARTLIVEIEAGTRNATPANLIKIAAALNCPRVVLERKREPEATPPAACEVRQPEVRGDERADEPVLSEVPGASVVGGAA